MAYGTYCLGYQTECLQVQPTNEEHKKSTKHGNNNAATLQLSENAGSIMYTASETLLEA